MGIKFNPFTGNLDIVNNPTIDGRVSNFASLPLASGNGGKIYLVETTTGVPFINRRPKGLYISDGADWALMPSSIQADKSLYDNSTSGLSASNVQEAIDEIALSSNIVGTRDFILNTTPSQGTSAYSTDTNEVFIYYNEWLQSSEILENRAGSVDIGVSQTSNLVGYGSDYVTDKLISNCSVGSNADEKNGAIRKVFASSLGRNLFQFWADGQWQTVLTGVNIQTDSSESIPDIEFTDFSPWVLSLITGDSDARDFNGEPLVKQMKIDMGAFSAPLTIDGGSF